MRSKFTLSVLLMLLMHSGCALHGREHIAAPATEPVAGGTDKWPEVYAHARDACLNYLSIPTNGLDVMNWKEHNRAIPEEYHHLLLAYLWAIEGEGMQRGEFRFVVVDEDDQPVDDATREVYDMIGLGNDLEPRFNIKTQRIVGEQSIELTDKMYGLEIHVDSLFHRSIQFRLPLGAPGQYNDPLMREAHTLLQNASLLPPLTAEGPVRVVTPFQCNWPDGSKEDRRGNVQLRSFTQRKVYRANGAVCISTEQPGYFVVRVRGFYEIADRDGISNGGFVCDPGTLLGLAPAGNYAKGRGEAWAWTALGSSGTLPTEKAPYSWRLEFEAVSNRHVPPAPK